MGELEEICDKGSPLNVHIGCGSENEVLYGYHSDYINNHDDCINNGQ